jgi:hypothetical protein
MKKLAITFLSLLWMSTLCYAQDVIVTLKAEKINAKILEVGTDEIKYKKFDYQTGPIFTLKKSEIVSIIYENGSVDVFTASTEPASPTGEVKYFDGDDDDNDQDSYSRGNYYIKGMAPMGKREYKDFLSRTCPKAYQKFRTGEKLYNAGIVTISVGGAMVLTGIICMAVGNNQYYWHDDYYYSNYYWYGEDTYFAGVGLYAVGMTLINVSIPLFISGACVMHAGSVSTYYSQCHNKTKTALNLDLHPNGVGLSLKF